jgi:hypothetical protein
LATLLTWATLLARLARLLARLLLSAALLLAWLTRLRVVLLLLVAVGILVLLRHLLLLGGPPDLNQRELREVRSGWNATIEG